MTSSWGVQSTADSLRSEGVVCICISLFVTLSVQVILMIECRCRIIKAYSFFTCRLYTAQASAPHSRVDSTTARYVLPLTRMDTWWLFQSLWRSRPKDALVLAILLCVSSSISWYSASVVGELRNRVQLVSIKYDIFPDVSSRVGLVQHLRILYVNFQAEPLWRLGESIQ